MLSPFSYTILDCITVGNNLVRQSQYCKNCLATNGKKATNMERLSIRTESIGRIGDSWPQWRTTKRTLLKLIESELDPRTMITESFYRMILNFASMDSHRKMFQRNERPQRLGSNENKSEEQDHTNSVRFVSCRLWCIPKSDIIAPQIVLVGSSESGIVAETVIWSTT